jgi:transposase
MQLHLNEVSRWVAPDAHVALVLDGAGWHHSKSLAIPPNITLCPLPPYCPELNPIERLWLRIKERHLSFKLYTDTEAIIAAGVAAWNSLTAAEVMSVCRVGAAPAR